MVNLQEGAVGSRRGQVNVPLLLLWDSKLGELAREVSLGHLSLAAATDGFMAVLRDSLPAKDDSDLRR